MKTLLHRDMIEAARLTQAGQLAEATALIQRLLGGGLASDTAADHPAGARQVPPIELTAENITRRSRERTRSTESNTDGGIARGASRHGLRCEAPRSPRTPAHHAPAGRRSGDPFVAPGATVAGWRPLCVCQILRTGRWPGLQAIHSERLPERAGTPDRDAARMHTIRRRFRNGHGYECTGREAWISRPLSSASPIRQ